MSPPLPPRTWTREVSGATYTISTDSSLIQLDALNEAFASDMVYWARPLSPDALKLCVEQSLCFGLYAPKEGNSQGNSPPFSTLVFNPTIVNPSTLAPSPPNTCTCALPTNYYPPPTSHFPTPFPGSQNTPLPATHTSH
jgi:hypothetical protein